MNNLFINKISLIFLIGKKWIDFKKTTRKAPDSASHRRGWVPVNKIF